MLEESDDSEDDDGLAVAARGTRRHPLTDAVAELLEDSDKEDGGSLEEDEAEETYGLLDEGGRTAAQVLDKANALSARILRVVTRWCGAGGGAGGRTA